MDAEHRGFEVEIKFRAVDHEALARRLEALGASGGEATDQSDLYLAHPTRDFAATGEALRLRRVGRGNYVTYKGPKHGGPTKTREEIEVPFEPGPEAGADLRGLFRRLGFRPVAEVCKRRRSYRLEREGRALEVTLDEVEGLGRFAEVEALAAGPDELPTAQAAVLALAAELGLSEIEPRSYLRMSLERLAEGGNPAGRD